VARWQLLDAGVSPDQVDLRLATGRLHELHRGVYLVGHAVPPPLAMETAALLACRKAILSHRTAGSLWKLLPYPAPYPACVTIPPARGATRPKLEVHRAPLDPRDVRRRHGLRLTSPPRTILDIAATSEPDELEPLIAEAQYRRLATDQELRDQLARNPGKRGVRRLREVLDLPGGARRTRSPSERELLTLLRRARIDGYEINARVHGYEVDFLFPDAGLVAEVDGYDAHSGRVAFERDRLKAATLTAHGLVVMHITGRQIRRDPDGVVARIVRAIDEARS
jgi:very-short-patch-repair endonuclease